MKDDEGLGFGAGCDQGAFFCAKKAFGRSQRANGTQTQVSGFVSVRRDGDMLSLLLTTSIEREPIV